MGRLLTYEPQIRIKPLDALAHPFFDELREKSTVLPNGKPLPELFNFHPEEIKIDPDIMDKLIPKWFN